MSVTHNRVVAKLKALDEYVSYLKDLQKINKKSFLDDYHNYGLAEHYLHLSIEAMLDVAKIIITAYQFPRPEAQRDVLKVLHEKKIITVRLYDKLQGVTGFRNVLIHEYDEIDRKLVYDFLQKNIDQFVEFKRQLRKFLRKRA